MREILGQRDLRLLLAAQAASQAGDWLYSVALVVYVLDTTGSAVWVAAAGLIRLLPWIVLGPLGGLVADRFDRHRILVAADLVQVVSMLLLAAIAASGGSPGVALAVAGIAATAGIASSPSLQAALPLLVAERNLAAVNSLLTALASLSMVVGPAVGAVLLLLGSPAAAFGLNALSFAVSAGCNAMVRSPMGPGLPDADASGAGDGTAAGGARAALRAARVDLVEGVRVLASSATAVALVLVAAGIYLAYGAQVVLWALLAEERLGGGTDSMTLLYVAYGVGGLAATAPASRAAGGRSGTRILAAGVAIGGLSVAALAAVAALVPAVALVGIQGFVVTIVDVLVITILQRALGPAVLGRAVGSMDSLNSLAMVAGSVLAPVLVGVGGIETAFVASGAVLVAVGVVAAVAARREPAQAGATESRVRLLAGLSLFSAAPRFAIEGLAAGCRELALPPGVVVIREGETPDALYVLVEGRADVTSGPGSRRLNTMVAGDFFGEIGLLKGIPRTATVTTTEPSVLLRIDGETFLSLVRTGVAHRGVLGRSVGTRLSRRGVAEPDHRPAAAPTEP